MCFPLGDLGIWAVPPMQSCSAKADLSLGKSSLPPAADPVGAHELRCGFNSMQRLHPN